MYCWDMPKDIETILRGFRGRILYWLHTRSQALKNSAMLLAESLSGLHELLFRNMIIFRIGVSCLCYLKGRFIYPIY